MEITLEQAKVFDAVARAGTVQRAASELHRGHSAILYSLKGLEDQLGFPLFDRSGYRNRLTANGEKVLTYCRKLLDARREQIDACLQIKTGWEPSLKVIYDEVIDFNFIGDALMGLSELKPPTEVKVLSAHLREVESLFIAEHADIMVTVSPISDLRIPSVKLSPIHMKLVAQSGHRLNNGRRGKLKLEELNRYTHVTIKTPDSALGLSTEATRFDSYFFVADFTTKWSAIRKGIGFGWLPDYLIADDLNRGVLKVLPTEIANSVKLQPMLLHRPHEGLGRAAKELLKFLK